MMLFLVGCFVCLLLADVPRSELCVEISRCVCKFFFLSDIILSLICIKILSKADLWRKMWNSFHLECPVQDVCEYSRKKSSKLESFQDLITILSSGADILTRDHPIWTEIKVFNNVQAKYKRILHCDKLLHLVQRVGRCLKKMVLLNLSRSYLDLAERFIIALQDPKATVQLPSRQQLEYILVRTQATSKLICEALEYSRETFCYLLQKLNVGHLLLDLLMATSVTARLHIMFKAILVQIYDLYKKLFSWLTKLKKGSWEWPSPLTLPNDLEEWLKPEHFDKLSKNSETSESQINALANYFPKKKANKIDKSEVIDLDPEEDVNLINCENQQLDEDLGEVVLPEKTSVENQYRKFTSSQKSILRKIYKAKTLEKLQTVWDNINAASEDLYPFMLTQKKINKINKLLDSVGKSEDNEYCATGKSKVPIMQNIRFRFTKHLGLVKNQEEYFHLAEEFSKKTKVIKFKPVKKIKELRKIYEEMCQHMTDASELEKLEKLSKYYEGQYAAVKELKKSGDLELTRKLIYYASKVLIRMFNKQ